MFNLRNTNRRTTTRTASPTQLQKRFSNSFEGMLAYTYQRSYSVWDLTSSVALSNWQFGRSYSGRQDAEELRPSKWDAPHRVIVSGTYTLPTQDRRLAQFFVGESGVPFEYVYGTDMNGDNFSSNDLIYVPKDAHDLERDPVLAARQRATGLTPAQQADSLEAYITGHVVPELAARHDHAAQLLQHAVDEAHGPVGASVAEDASARRTSFCSSTSSTSSTCINKNWGAQDLGSTNSPLLLTRTGFTGGTKMAVKDGAGNAVTGGGAQPIFTFSPSNFATQFSTRNASSNYALQLQLKYTF